MAARRKHKSMASFRVTNSVYCNIAVHSGWEKETKMKYGGETDRHVL